jgi:hypothetical protein
VNRAELCIALALPDDASVHAIRSRVARVATGRAEFGSSPAQRAALFAALHLAPSSGDLAALRVVESILRPHPLSYRRNLHTGVVDARGAMTFGKLAAAGVTLGELADAGFTLGDLASLTPGDLASLRSRG